MLPSLAWQDPFVSLNTALAGNSPSDLGNSISSCTIVYCSIMRLKVTQIGRCRAWQELQRTGTCRVAGFSSAHFSICNKAEEENTTADISLICGSWNQPSPFKLKKENSLSFLGSSAEICACPTSYWTLRYSGTWGRVCRHRLYHW